MQTPSASPAVDESVKDWDSPIRKAFNELRSSIAGLSHRPTGHNVLTFRRFVSEELQCVSSAFNAYFDSIGIAGPQSHSVVELSSEASNLVLTTSEDLFTEMFSASQVDFDCDRVMESWDNERSRTSDQNFCCDIARTPESQSTPNIAVYKAVEESEPLGSEDNEMLANSTNSPNSPPECFVSDAGVCPLNLMVSSEGFDTANLSQCRTNLSMAAMSSHQGSESTFSDHGDSIFSPSLPELESNTPQSDMCLSICADSASVDESGEPPHDTVARHPCQITIRLFNSQHQGSCSQAARDSANITANVMEEAEQHEHSAEADLEPVSDQETEQQITHRLKQPAADKGSKNDEHSRPAIRERLMQKKSLKARHRHRTRTSTLFQTQMPQYAQQGLLTTSPSQTEEVFKNFIRELRGNVEQAGFLTQLYHAVASPDAFLQLKQTLQMARACTFPDMSKVDSSASAAAHALDSLDSTSSLSHILRRHYLLRLLQFRVDQENKYKTSRQLPKKKRRLKYDISRIDNIGKQHVSNTKPPEVNACDKNIQGRSDSLAIRDLYALVYPHEKYGSQTDMLQKKRLEKLKTRLACARTWSTFTREFSDGVLALIPSGGDYKISIDQVERLPSATLHMFLGHLQRGRGAFIASVSKRLGLDIFNILSGHASETSQFALETVDELSLSQMAPDSCDLEMLCRR